MRLSKTQGKALQEAVNRPCHYDKKLDRWVFHKNGNKNRTFYSLYTIGLIFVDAWRFMRLTAEGKNLLSTTGCGACIACLNNESCFDPP